MLGGAGTSIASPAGSSFAGVAAVSAGAVVGGSTPSAAQAAETADGLHGAPLRGMYLTSKDRLAEGRFGAMFKRLPAFAPRDDLLEVWRRRWSRTRRSRTTAFSTPARVCSPGSRSSASSSTTTSPSTTRRSPSSRRTPTPPSTSGRRATTSTRSTAAARRPSRSSTIRPTRTSCWYAERQRCRGHAARQQRPRDHPRARNDENLIILQFHKAVAKFHNRIVDYARAQGMRREWVFETARRLTRWHYQWAVIHDFLPRFVGDELVGTNGTVYREVAGKPPVITLSYYKPTNKDGRPFMPVEFAVAAYRFGHSIIRPFYVINQSTLDRGGVPVFGPDGGFNLNGGRPIPSDLVMEWKNILPVDPAFPARKPRKIDTKLSLPLDQPPGLGRAAP